MSDLRRRLDNAEAEMRRLFPAWERDGFRLDSPAADPYHAAAVARECALDGLEAVRRERDEAVAVLRQLRTDIAIATRADEPAAWVAEAWQITPDEADRLDPSVEAELSRLEGRRAS